MRRTPALRMATTVPNGFREASLSERARGTTAFTDGRDSTDARDFTVAEITDGPASNAAPHFADVNSAIAAQFAVEMCAADLAAGSAAATCEADPAVASAEVLLEVPALEAAVPEVADRMAAGTATGKIRL